MRPNAKPIIDQVIYNFKKNPTVQIDIVPIAARLLTPVNIARTSAPHRTDFYRIIWFQTGDPIHTVDLQQIPIKSPALLFVHKDRVHKFDPHAPHDGKVLIFTDEFYCKSPSDSTILSQNPLFCTPHPVLLKNPCPELKSLILGIESEIQNDKELLKKDILHSMLSTLLYTAQRIAVSEFAEPTGPANEQLLANDQPLVNAFTKLVDEKFTQRLSLKQYSALLNVSISKLNGELLKYKGKTGKEILTERVLLEAKRLLAYSPLAVKEIGFKLGFEQPTNFIKFFHNNTGQTPAEFQRSKK